MYAYNAFIDDSLLPICLVALLLGAGSLHAEPLTIATASNFAAVAEDIGGAFEVRTGEDVRMTVASTGKLYAQIVNGAPFDVFLAADRRRPLLLEKSGIGVSGSRFTYALGELALWSRQVDDCRASLDTLGNRRIAIANPETAPYGAAAREFLQRAGLWDALGSRLAIAENISQALQFAATGNAALGIVARSQLHMPALPEASCTWPVPVTMHAPIAQQAILLRRASENRQARRFLEFLRSRAGRDIVAGHGYRLPETPQ